MKKYILLVTTALLFFACSSSNPAAKRELLHIPTDMPDICQNVDFHIDKEMRKDCGVKPVRYQAYRNVPMQRHLINPNQASLVKTGDRVEIRFPNTFPVRLDSAQISGVDFSDSKRLSKIQNTMDYKEFYTEHQERYKLFKLAIPSDSNPKEENILCFRVPEPRGSDRTRSAAMGVQMEVLPCETLDELVSKYAK
ncbi:MAG: hypothetical protein LBU89_11805 [Fibromonadaceae bacterium]|jgi:hypothetical protein|nr:hypothetical protein [Fibromonadaceae bacterium]